MGTRRDKRKVHERRLEAMRERTAWAAARWLTDRLRQSPVVTEIKGASTVVAEELDERLWAFEDALSELILGHLLQMDGVKAEGTRYYHHDHQLPTGTWLIEAAGQANLRRLVLDYSADALLPTKPQLVIEPLVDWYGEHPHYPMRVFQTNKHGHCCSEPLGLLSDEEACRRPGQSPSEPESEGVASAATN